MFRVIRSIILLSTLNIIIRTSFGASIPLDESARDKRQLYQYPPPPSSYPFKPSQQVFTEPSYYPPPLNYGFVPSPGPQPLQVISPVYRPPQKLHFSEPYEPPVDTYVVDGRILKQYEVMEKLHEDERNELLSRANDLLASRDQFSFGRSLQNDPFSYDQDYVNNFLTNELPFYRNLNFKPGRISPNVANQRPPRPIYNRNHGPVALGSGSLGYLRLSNGVVFIGSGSLGYISQQQHSDYVQEKQRRLNLVPGPLSFGPSSS